MALLPFNRKVTTTDNEQKHNTLETWQSELVVDLQNIIDALKAHSPDQKTIAAQLRHLHVPFYADKIDNQIYHLQAKKDNKTTKTRKVK